MIQNLDVRLASLNDVNSILKINEVWLKRGKSDQIKSSGFLFGEAYTAQEIEALVFLEQVTIAVLEGKILGYFLFDNLSRNETSQFNLYHLNRLQSDQLLPSDGICPRAQIAISEKYHGLGISKKLHSFLVKHQKGRFNSIFSVVAKSNPKFEAHLSSGWKIITEDENYYFCLLDLNDQLYFDGPNPKKIHF